MIVLGIETSCDETSVAVVKDGKEVLSNIVATQIDIHKKFGGVVPEVASRLHVESFLPVLEEAMKTAKVTFDDIDLIAVTEGPGLIGALLVGINAAKALSFSKGIPLIGVDHISGHIYANNISNDLEFPLLSLVASGGHTELVVMKGHYDFNVIGKTLDDAVGEAYDKVARVLGLQYPGGPHVDKLSKEGIDEYKFKRSMIDSGDYNFSFSGIKSSVINLNHKYNQNNKEINKANLACSFQECVTDILVTKTAKALKEYNIKNLVIAGGVASNTSLRKKISKLSVNVNIPNLEYCTDNAAMIAVSGYFKFKSQKIVSDLSMNGYSTK